METTGRFAPSPSGRLHLGNLLCALLVWLSARQKGGRVLLRVEDLDTARCPRRYAAQMEADLSWLGRDWDIGPGKDGVTRLNVVIRQGKNRQVRRMCAQAGLKVLRLKRVREGSLKLDRALKPGQWRPLSPAEEKRLRDEISLQN